MARVAGLGGCALPPRVETLEGEVDGVMSVNGHVALVEITSTSNGNTAPYKERVLRLVRDVRVLLRRTVASRTEAEEGCEPIVGCALREW